MYSSISAQCKKDYITKNFEDMLLNTNTSQITFDICEDKTVQQCQENQIQKEYLYNKSKISICSYGQQFYNKQETYINDPSQCGQKYAIPIEYIFDNQSQITYECITACPYYWYFYNSYIKFCTKTKNCDGYFDSTQVQMVYLNVKLLQCIPFCLTRTFQYDDNIQACSEYNDTCNNYNSKNQLLKFYDQKTNSCLLKCHYNSFYRQYATLIETDDKYQIAGKDARCTENNNCIDAYDSEGQKLQFLYLPDRICFSEFQPQKMRKILFNNETIGIIKNASCYFAIDEEGNSLQYYDIQQDLCISQCKNNWYQYKKDYLYDLYNNYELRCTLKNDCQEAIDFENQIQLSVLKIQTKQCIEKCQERMFIYDNINNIVGCLTNNYSCDGAINITGQQYEFYDQQNNICKSDCIYNWYNDYQNGKICTIQQSCNDILNSQGEKLEYYQQTDKQCISQCQKSWYIYNKTQFYCSLNVDCSDEYCIQYSLNYLLLDNNQCQENVCEYLQFDFSPTTFGCTLTQSCQNVKNIYGELQRNYDQINGYCVSQCQYYSYQYVGNIYYCSYQNNCKQAINKNGVLLQYLDIETQTCIYLCQYRVFQYNRNVLACTSENQCTNAYNEDNLLLQFYDIKTSQCIFQCDYYWYQYNMEKYCTDNNSCNVYDYDGTYLKYIQEDSLQCTDCKEIGYKPKNSKCVKQKQSDQNKTNLIIIVSSATTATILLLVLIVYCIKRTHNRRIDDSSENKQSSFMKDVSIGDFDKFCSSHEIYDNQDVFIAIETSK